MKNTRAIKNSSFFQDFDDADIDKISRLSIERSYPKNTVLFNEGDPGSAFYYILSGKVKVFRTYADGNEHLIHILGPGDVFGEATLFNDVPYPASASVYEDAVIGTIKNSDMENLVKSDPNIALKLLKVFSRKLVFAQQKIKDLTTYNDVFSRTASQLLTLAETHGARDGSGIKLNIKLSRQELADLVSTTRETVSRVISRFKKEGAIREENGYIVITDENKLGDWV